VKEKHVYLLHVFRKRLGYPELKRAVREQAEAFSPQTILIEDKASGTQLIQELVSEGMHAIQKYEPAMDKIMRMHSVTSTIENGFVHLPDQAAWLGEYLHELTSFPRGKYDDQADSTSQALDWIKHKPWDIGWPRILARRNMIKEGRFKEVREMDEEYGPPPGEPLVEPTEELMLEPPEEPRKSPPSGPVVYTLPR
jgi:predicted phage terminase large subunit-like protein